MEGGFLLKRVIVCLLLLFSSVAIAKNGVVFGPTKARDDLWQIAKVVRQNHSVTNQQVMLALLQKNPSAFYVNNINGLKGGYLLTVPSLSKIRKISALDAIKEIKHQNKVWKYFVAIDKGSFAVRDETPFNQQNVQTQKISQQDQQSSHVISYKIPQQKINHAFNFLLTTSPVLMGAFGIIALLLLLILWKYCCQPNASLVVDIQESKFTKPPNYKYLAGEDVVTAKLNLAHAYYDMSDYASAEEILHSVIEEGTQQQREEAQNLLTKIKQ